MKVLTVFKPKNSFPRGIVNKCFRIGLWILLISNSCLFYSAFAQELGFKEIDYIPVRENGKYLKYPWAGGLNSAQFCDPDLNADGVKDLLVYEKTENRVLTFIYNNGGYSLDRAYTQAIPAIEGWVVMKDINCDGIEDLFTYKDGSIEVYKGKYVQDTLKFDHWADEIFYYGNSGKINLYASFVDRPAIADIDFDGDLDIMTFSVSANRILLYRNQRIEKSLTCDTLAFILNDNCWGNIYESGQSPMIDTRDTCTIKIYNGKSDVSERKKHSGSTLEAYDIRNKGVMDLLMGDVTLSLMNHLKNDGTLLYASVLQQDTSYPSYDVPVKINSFPLATFIDIDHDGKKDLLVTPFEGIGVDNYENVWLYRNIGLDSVHLQYISNSFMVGDMIDMGESSAATAMDIDGDGLNDLIVGGAYRKNNSIQYKLHYYKNIGDKTYPVFELKDEDFLKFSSTGYFEPFPQAGDLDNDGKKDLLVGISDGRILFYKNTVTSGFQSDSPIFLQTENQVLDVGQNATPFVVDIDKDAINDLVVGEFNGNVNIYKNAALSGSVQLQQVTDSLGKLTTKTGFLPFGYSSPIISDMDEDGKLDLIVGGYDNVLQFVSNIEDSLLTTVHPQDMNLSTQRIGRRLTPFYIDFTDNNDGTLILGQYSGGLRWFSQRPPEEKPVGVHLTSTESIKINLYPNPNEGEFTIQTPSNLNKALFWTISDMSGRTLMRGNITQVNEKIDIYQLFSGVYVFSVSDREQILSGQLLIKLK